MRIVHRPNHCDHWDGNVHIAIGLACAQAEAGHDVVVANSAGRYQPLLREVGVTTRSQHERTSLSDAVPRAVAQLVKAHRDRKADGLHAHMRSGELIGFATSRLTAARPVTAKHNSFDRHAALMRVGHPVVAVSRAEKDLLVKRGYRPDRMEVVLNGPNNSRRDSRVSNATIGRPRPGGSPFAPSRLTRKSCGTQASQPDAGLIPGRVSRISSRHSQLAAEPRNFMTCDENRQSYWVAAKRDAGFFDVKRLARGYEAIDRTATMRRAARARLA